jgi:hypothetical protein
MIDKKIAPTSAATLAEARHGDGGKNHLTQNFTTPRASRQAVIAYLGRGKANALTATELAQMMGLRDPRIVTRQIELARKTGSAICASNGGDQMGYFLAADERELSAYLRSLDRRLKHTHATRRALGDTLARLGGQSEIEGW